MYWGKFPIKKLPPTCGECIKNLGKSNVGEGGTEGDHHRYRNFAVISQEQAIKTIHQIMEEKEEICELNTD